MNILFLDWSLAFLIQTVILFGLVMVLAKIQKLDQHEGFHFLKILGVVALASALNLVPFFGRYLSGLALLAGIKFVTRSPYVDVAFTVVISYAVMFLMKLFLLGALMGDLRSSPSDDRNAGPSMGAVQEPVSETESDTVEPTNPPVPATAPQVAVKPAPAGPNYLAIKGLTRNGAKSVVILDSGVKTYTLFLGDSANVETADGTKAVKFESLDADWVTLDVDGKPVKLPAH